MGGAQSEELQGPDLGNGIDFEQLEESVPFLGHVGGEQVILVRHGAQVLAVSANCKHYGGPLAEGIVAEGIVRCPWHHARYDLRTGRNVGAPGLDSLSCYAVERAEGRVRVTGKHEPSAPDAPEGAPGRVVIIGAGAAGEACAETLRQEGYAGSITMFGTSEPFTVDRPNLSKDYLAGNAPEEWLPVRGDDFFEEHQITFSQDEVTAIDRDAKVIHAAGKQHAYDVLVLATGAKPRTLPTPGADKPHVHTLRTLSDAQNIVGAVEEGAKTAVIIGAGFIGLEAAASLTRQGLSVRVVAPDEVPLERVMGGQVGSFVQSIHERNGVTFHLGHTVDTIEDGSVTLDDGTTHDADLVVMGVGVIPNTSLAEDAGLTVDRGVEVDAMLRTSDSSIYAAGDIAKFPYGGEKVRVEHWVVAQRQGQAVARDIVGRGKPLTETPFFWSHHWDVGLSYVGHATTTDYITVHGSLEEGDAAVIYRGEDGVIQAVLTIGRDDFALRAEYLMEIGNLDALEEILAV